MSAKDALVKLAESWEKECAETIEANQRGEKVANGNGLVMYVGTLNSCAIQLRALAAELERRGA